MIAQVDDKTIRHVNCSMLVKPDGICEQCKLYKKNSLLRQLNRLLKDNKENDLCSASSHVNYRFLTGIQKNERLKALHSELRAKCRQLHSLEKKIQQLHEKEAVTLDDDSDCDMRALVEKYSSIVMSSQPENSNRSFQYLFWKQQLDAITKSDARSIRWHPLIIKWCLYLHHRSSGAYKTLRESGLLSLPSGRILRDYRHFAPAKSGFSTAYDQQLLDLATKTNFEMAKNIAILIDEMYVKEGLVYNKTSGALTGFVELGDIDSHLNEYKRSIYEPKKQKSLAKTIVVFMVRGVVTSLIFPYTIFPVSSLKGYNLFPLVWEVIGRLTRHDFRVWAIICDGASNNRKMFRMHSSTGDENIFKTTNVYSEDQYPIYFICDPPHLLKTIRNCFASSTRNLWVSSFCVSIYDHLLYSFYFKV